jgi:CheY-like chemotaxis protein
MQKKRDSFARDENTAGNLSPFAKAPQPCCNQILVVDDNTFNVTSLTLIM